MELHEAVKHVRCEMKMKQQQVYDGIVSPSTYSRFENGTRMLHIQDLEKILDRLGMQLSDIDDIQKQRNEHITYIRDQINKGLKNELTEMELAKLYAYTKKLKNHSLIFLRNYYFIRQYFHSKCYIIPPISTEEVDFIYNRIRQSEQITSIYLQFIIDFMSHFSDQQLIRIADKFLKMDRPQMLSLHTTYVTKLPDLLINLSDTFIDRGVKTGNMNNQFFPRVPPILEAFLALLKQRNNFDYSIVYTLQKHRYLYYTAQDDTRKRAAREQLVAFKEKLKIVESISPYPNEYTESCIKSINNLLENEKPSEENFYIKN